MPETVTFHAGRAVGESDDEKTVQWDDDVSLHGLVKEALAWSAGRWCESDSAYDACVWVETASGDLLAHEHVTISADGEMDYPA